MKPMEGVHCRHGRTLTSEGPLLPEQNVLEEGSSPWAAASFPLPINFDKQRRSRGGRWCQPPGTEEFRSAVGQADAALVWF